MARNRTPTSILDAKGSFLAKPGRQAARANEPTTDRPIGPPPTHLSKEEKKVWKELVRRSCPGVLLESDRQHFELLVRLTWKMRSNFDLMKVGEMSQFISLGARFAMTPADRSKVSVEKPKTSSLSLFLAKKVG